MKDLINVLLLGIIEGLTEFLPVSSTGHLILAERFIRLYPESFANAFMIIIQLGAILAVVVMYFEKLNPFSTKKMMRKVDMSDYPNLTLKEKLNFRIKYLNKATLRLWIIVVIGFLPAMVLGLLFDDLIDKYLFSPYTVAIMLIVWGIIIIVVEKYIKRPVKAENVFRIGPKQALKIGFFQCMAMVPGTSRSAATIIGGMLTGANRTAASEFSFFLAIPTMLGATVLKIIKLGADFTLYQWGLILFGSVISYIAARLVVARFMRYIKSHSFAPFGIYRIILGFVSLLFLLRKG
ncbi:MAG: undecaprenyl-diphosphate phosphatase [Tissierellia bacterium]|nr:undecaprenyl-diphosphate phosphatase [Tissierellia bacterium]